MGGAIVRKALQLTKRFAIGGLGVLVLGAMAAITHPAKQVESFQVEASPSPIPSHTASPSTTPLPSPSPEESPKQVKSNLPQPKAQTERERYDQVMREAISAGAGNGFKPSTEEIEAGHLLRPVPKPSADSIEPSPEATPFHGGTETGMQDYAPSPSPAPVQEPESRGFVPGTCKELRALGLSRFTEGDPNYTPQRDRDRDGIACE
jgi:hypothetical protein